LVQSVLLEPVFASQVVRDLWVLWRLEMRMTRMSIALVVFMLLARPSAGARQRPPARPATPVDPIAAIIEAFRTHNVVAVTDPHGNV
jgi:hypothetical protein